MKLVMIFTKNTVVFFTGNYDGCPSLGDNINYTLGSHSTFRRHPAHQKQFKNYQAGTYLDGFVGFVDVGSSSD